MDSASEIAEYLRERRGEIEDTILARVRAVPDQVGDTDPEYIARLRAGIAAVLDSDVKSVEQGAEEPPEPIPAAALAHARRAALLGVSQRSVLRPYVVCHTVMDEYVMHAVGSVGLPAHGAAVSRIRRARATLFERLLDGIAGAYADEAQRARNSPDERRGERVRRVLAGELSADGVELGYEFDAWHLGLVATGADAVRTLRDFARLARSSLCVPVGERTAWAWLGGTRKLTFAELRRGLSTNGSPAEGNRGVSLAVGEPGEGVEGFRRTHRQAQAAMSVALCRPQTLTRYADVALLTPWVSGSEPEGSLVDMYLAPLDQAPNGATLRATLRAYFDAGRNTKAAAIALRVDRNTVAKRLSAIESLYQSLYLGHPLETRFAELEVALRLEELRAARDDRRAGAEDAPVRVEAGA